MPEQETLQEFASRPSRLEDESFKARTQLSAVISDRRDLPLPSGPRDRQDLTLSHPADFSEVVGLSRRLDLGVTCKQATDDDLKNLSGMKNIVSLDLSRTGATDAGLRTLEGLSELKCLNLRWTETTENCVKSVLKMTNLKTLDITDTGITDNGIEQLQALPKLERLNLGGYEVSDSTLALLKDFPSLKQLSLTGNVTVDGLRQLKDCTKLTRLDLDKSKLDVRKLMQISAALPGVAIYPSNNWLIRWINGHYENIYK